MHSNRLLLTGYLVVVWAALIQALVPIARTRTNNLLPLRAATQEGNEGGVDEFMNVVINGVPSSMGDATPNAFNGYSTSGYSAFLGKNRDDLDEDGYADMMKRKNQRSFWKKVARLPVSAVKKVWSSGRTKEPGTLILVRHGESTWYGELGTSNLLCFVAFSDLSYSIF